MLAANKCIDGIFYNKQPSYIDKPNWYISSKNIKEDIGFHSENNEYERNKINIEKLVSFLVEKNIGIDIPNDDKSIIQCFVNIAAACLIEIMRNKSTTENSSFINEEDIEFLTRNGKIDLKLIENELENTDFNKKILKDKYIEYLCYMKQCKFHKESITAGQIEKDMLKEAKTHRIKEKMKFQFDFRKFVFDYKYKFEDERMPNYETHKKINHSDSGICSHSRVLNLYLTLRNTPDYYIAWEFYDILCYLKNYASDLKNKKVCQVSSVPVTIPMETLKAFSPAKLKNIFNQ